jgi:Zn-dependent peptidase ImmA (M78 family)
MRFVLTWDDPHPRGTAAEATRGRLDLRVGDRVWGVPHDSTDPGIHWTWIEMLEHLSDIWKPLLWEEADPLGLDCSPSRLRASAEERWLERSSSLREREQESLWSFQQRHDLAAALQGAWPPSLWIVRRGNYYLIDGMGAAVLLPVDEVLEVLGNLGGQIAARVRDLQDGRALDAVEMWEDRSKSSWTEFLRLATGLDEETIESVPELSRPESGQVEVDEIVAAARMLGPMSSPQTLRAVLRHIANVPRRRTEELDRLASLVAHGRDLIGTPFEQGYRIARQLRSMLGISEQERVDPLRLLQSWGVGVSRIRLQSEDLDALAAWGPKHGPVVLLNLDGAGQSESRRRATLSHEIAHLLVDRSGALPLTEVLGGRVPTDLEARANAFAAEFLLPRSAARRLSGTDKTKSDLDRLCEDFGVSRELAAWQARNSEVPLSAQMRALLLSHVSEPRRF